MKKKGIHIFVIFVGLISFLGCERDDICVDAPITPLLVVTFRDNDPNVDASSRVLNLQVNLLEDGRPFFPEPISTDSIRIPLNTITSNTVFRFTRNVDDVNTANTATDTINFSYSPNNIYVNRACGFKTIFSDLSVTINEETGNNNWIQRVEVLNTNVDDEPNTHIQLFF